MQENAANSDSINTDEDDFSCLDFHSITEMDGKRLRIIKKKSGVNLKMELAQLCQEFLRLTSTHCFPRYP